MSPPRFDTPDVPKSSEIIEKFNQSIEILFKPNNSHARSLLAFVRRTLWQFHLNKSYSEMEILIEAYLRGIHYLQKPSGKTISNPGAWVRVTAYNIIREYSRKRKVQRSRIVHTQSDFSLLDSTEVADETVTALNIAAVFEAFKKLRHNDRKIIELRYLENRSWKDIREKLEEPKILISTLRKRGQRALKRLRQEYHKIRPQNYQNDD